MVPLRSALAALLIAAAAPAQAVELAQNSPITNAPNLVLPPIATMPDLAVTKVAVSVKCTDGHFFTATISATVMNKGGVTADLTKIQNELETDWYSLDWAGHLDGPSNQTIKPTANVPVLKPQQTWSTTLRIKQVPEYKKGISKTSQYAFVVYIDRKNQMPEADEKNNVGAAYPSDPCPK
jgi:hypothetical protein